MWIFQKMFFIIFWLNQDDFAENLISGSPSQELSLVECKLRREVAERAISRSAEKCKQIEKFKIFGGWPEADTLGQGLILLCKILLITEQNEKFEQNDFCTLIDINQ